MELWNRTSSGKLSFCGFIVEEFLAVDSWSLIIKQWQPTCAYVIAVNRRVAGEKGDCRRVPTRLFLSFVFTFNAEKLLYLLPYRSRTIIYSERDLASR